MITRGLRRSVYRFLENRVLFNPMQQAEGLFLSFAFGGGITEVHTTEVTRVAKLANCVRQDGKKSETKSEGKNVILHAVKHTQTRKKIKRKLDGREGARKGAGELV